jgi:hypothetical protein
MAEQAKQPSYDQYLRIRNSHSHPVTMSLEPWGEELSISPKATYELAARGPEGDCLHVDFAPTLITIYGWSGSVLTVYHEGKVIKDCEQPVPATPKRATEH